MFRKEKGKKTTKQKRSKTTGQSPEEGKKGCILLQKERAGVYDHDIRNLDAYVVAQFYP